MSQGRMLGNIQARRAVGDAPWTTNRGSTDYLRTLARMAPSRSKNFRGRLAHAQQWPTRARAISRFGSVPRSTACLSAAHGGCGRYARATLRSALGSDLSAHHVPATFARGPERATVEQVSFLRSRALRLARFR